MYKFIAILIIPLFITVSGITDNSMKIDKQSFNEAKIMAFSDLTEDQKSEAIEHFKSTGNCEYNGIKLYGKVQFVTSFPDIKIEFVTSFPDIKVQFVTSFPDDCGQWQVVESFPDFKVEVVTSFPDLKVETVTSFPGMN